MVAEICVLCGDNRQLDDIEVCSQCATDSRLLGETARRFAPKAHRQAVENTPDWATRHREAQVSGEMFDDEYRGSEL